MLPKNPQWVDQNSSSSVQPCALPTHLVYDHLGPIPFPKAGFLSGLVDHIKYLEVLITNCPGAKND